MARRTIDERLAELQEKQKQLKAQERQLKARVSAERRKKETRQKIILGGAVLSVLGREYHEGDEQRLIAFLKAQDMRGNYFSKAMDTELPLPTEKENDIF